MFRTSVSGGEVQSSGVTSAARPAGAVPRPRPALLHRPRLEKLCAPLLPLTVVQGAAGFGRTTFLRHWEDSLRTQGHLVVPLETEPAEAPVGDQTSAVPLVVRALAEVGLAEISVPADLPALAALLRSVDHPIVLTLDSPETPDGVALVELTRLLSRCPNLHLVITADARHPVTRLVSDAALDQRFVIAQDLALTVEETVDLAARSGVVTSLAEAERVQTALGGWPALVHRVLIDSAPVWPRIDWSGIALFLEEHDVTASLGATGRGDLLTLALAGSISSSLWMHGQRDTPGTSGPFGRLRALDVLGFARKDYHPRSGEPRWTMPWALADALVAQLQRETPEEVLAAHRRLAHALVAEGLVREGLGHAVRSQDSDLVEELWAVHGTAPLTAPPGGDEELPTPPSGGSSMTVQHLRATFDALARPTPRDTRLAMVAAERRLASSLEDLRDGHRISARERTVVTHVLQQAALHTTRPYRARELLESWSIEQPSSSYFSSWVRTSSALGALVSDDHDGALRAAQKTDPLLRGPGEADCRAVLSGVEALLLVREGRLAAAEAALVRSHSAQRDEHGLTMLRGLQAVTGALLAMARLDLERLDRQLADAYHYGADHDVVAPLYFAAVAMLSALEGQPARGLAVIRAADQLGQRSLLGRRVLRRSAVDLLCAVGEVNLAQALLDDDDLGPGHHAAQVRVLLAAGEHDQARVLASRFAWSKSVAPGERAALLVARAAVEEAAGDTARAARLWAHARELTADGDLLAYALLPAPLRDLTLDATGAFPDATARERVSHVRLDIPADGTLVRLTPRERVVLRELARCDTLNAVASSLTVSVNTVKKQTLRIYAKLGVNGRAAALQRAQQLGLL